MIPATPLRPRTLGKDSVAPYSELYEPIGMTAGSEFRHEIEQQGRGPIRSQTPAKRLSK
jgi:hypothetical protein